MAFTTINKGSSYFNTVLYTGNGSSPRSLTGVGFSPDFVWIKSRSDTYSHSLYNSVTGGSNYLMTDSTSAEQPNWGVINSFDADGFTVATGTSGILHVNGSGSTYASWNWRGSDSSAVSNTSGTISSTVSANTTAGFSIVSYTGNGSNGATIGHGLGVAPKMVIVKSRSNTGDWAVYHASLTAGNMLFLNTAGESRAISGYDNGGINPVSSTTFTTAQGGSTLNNVNGSGRTYIAYCFADVKGFSKFGSYTGNGSTDGPFVYTGFKPSWVLLKDTTTGGNGWEILDNKRNTYNVMGERLYPNLSDAGSTATLIDFLSNGFKLRTSTDTWINTSGNTYIYAAFAENPFVLTDGTPVTAR